MHLRSAVLRNFRCFGELEIQLHPRLTVLVADNGGGKTAVLDGIAIGLSPLLQALSTADQRLSGPGIADIDFRRMRVRSDAGALRDRPYDSPESGPELPPERWLTATYAQVALETSDGLRWDHWRPSARGHLPQETIGQVELNRFAGSLLNSLPSQAPYPLPVVAYYETHSGRRTPRRRTSEELTTKPDVDQPTSALFGALHSASDLRESLQWFHREAFSELISITEAHRQRDESLLAPSSQLNFVRRAIEAILDSGYSNPRFNRRRQFVIDTEDGPTLEISQLSQGYQRMLGLAMDFARRLAVANPWIGTNSAAPSSVERETRDLVIRLNPYQGNLAPFGPSWAPAIMLVDEIDLHLHPSWQQRVLADLMRAFPGTQFIVTTHSPQVISTVKREHIRELVRESEDRWIAREPQGEETLGVESSDALRSVFGVDPIPPVEAAGWYREYLRRIELGTQTDPEGVALRQKLLDLYAPNHPLMLDAERLLRFQELKRRTSPPRN